VKQNEIQYFYTVCGHSNKGHEKSSNKLKPEVGRRKKEGRGGETVKCARVTIQTIMHFFYPVIIWLEI